MATIADVANGVPTIASVRSGPVATFRRRTTASIYVALCAIGLVPSLTGASPAWQAAGLGLWLPGAGFLALGPWGLLATLFTLALFVVSLIAWFGAGMVIAPLGVWLGALALAAAVAPGEAWPGGVYATVLLAGGLNGFMLYKARTKRAADVAQLAKRNAYLPQAMADHRETRVPVPDAAARELTLDQLRSLRYALDRALQPVEGLAGFDKVDQFQTAALRYQINHLAYALAMAQCHYTPSFHGYLSQGQRNLIEKYLRREIWNYWIYETAWGHLNFTNFDPAGRDNVMLTGFFGIQVGLYMSNTGDRRYVEPGSLTFKLNEKTQYRHSFKNMAESIIENFRTSAFCLYPCEPNWIYPICNHYGMTTVTLYDRLYGTSHVRELLPNWLHMLDTELTDQKGSPIGLRSSLVGWTPPVPSFDGLYVPYANTFVPDRAERLWANARTEMGPLIAAGEDGRERLTLPGKGADFGNYRTGHGLTYAQLIAGAREMGDYGFAEACELALDEVCAPMIVDGVRRYEKASNLANAHIADALIHRREDFRIAVREGPAESALRGPILGDARYPDVLVARAFSHGEDLELVLYPNAEAGRQMLGLERLLAGRAYDCAAVEGGRFLADAAGRASIQVMLDGRTAIRIAPAG
ncbi:hypothetical protein [Sphingomonas profundi]|uniref:linalool dehydratase/isomerase domain-containing protein n=1 Tax=Alterirhizorhabdus profundi TaxID=2681549 RepID=UPI0012E8E548|nr:hypothetical protein [Sphingomonas profundi]